VVAESRHHVNDDVQEDTSKFFASAKHPPSETNKSRASTRATAERQISRDGRGQRATRSISDRSVQWSSDRRKPQEDANLSGRSSSSYFTWSKSGRHSSKAASYPKAPNSIRTAAFQFKPGPFRSSSVGAVEKSVNSTIQRAQPIKRVRSDGAKYATTLNLSGGSSTKSYQQAVLSSEGAQHGDKKPRSFLKGATNKKFGPQKDAQFLPHQDSFKSSDIEQPAAGKAHLESPSCQNHLKVGQLSNERRLKTFPDIQHDSSSSMELLLKNCKIAQRERSGRILHIDDENLVPSSAIPSSNQTFKFFPRFRGGERLEVDEPYNGSTIEGFLGAYAEEVGPGDDELSIIDTWNTRAVDEQQEQLLWPHEDEEMMGNHDIMMDEMDGERVESENWLMEITDQNVPPKTFAIETRLEQPRLGFWRPHRLY
jgi:hypothetical protein